MQLPENSARDKSFNPWLRYACARDWREGNFNLAEGEAFLAAARAGIAPERALEVVCWLLSKAGHVAVNERTGEHLVRAYSDIVAEIADGFFGARERKKQLSKSASPAPRLKWPSFEEERVRGIAAKWKESSRAAWEEGSPTVVSALTTQDVLSHIFRSGEFGCRGREVYDFETLPLEWFLRNAERSQFVVLNPMKGRKGKKKNGASSAKCNDNVKKRLLLVVEFDSKKFGALATEPEVFMRLQAALHRHLSEIQPLALLVFSGNESLHGAYAVQDRPDEQLIYFMHEAVALGADSMLWTPSQFTRMPGGWNRKHRVRQTIHYFDPGVIHASRT